MDHYWLRTYLIKAACRDWDVPELCYALSSSPYSWFRLLFPRPVAGVRIFAPGSLTFPSLSFFPSQALPSLPCPSLPLLPYPFTSPPFPAPSLSPKSSWGSGTYFATQEVVYNLAKGAPAAKTTFWHIYGSQNTSPCNIFHTSGAQGRLNPLTTLNTALPIS